MAETTKKYYWIKLKTNFFNTEQIDFLMSQDNGSEYVVLYQMLCLNTANNNGELASKIGEMIVPYNVDKIVRDTKYFKTDTVIVALELFKKLGLIYEENHNVLKIANFGEMVGSETSSAKRVREYRERQKALQCNTNVTQENRVKRLDIREKSIDIDKEIETEIITSDKAEAHLPYKEIVDYLNKSAGTNYRASSKKTQQLIRARINEGFTLEDFRVVIEKKTREWINDNKMKAYLRPETLFGTKFEGYLNQPVKELTTKDLTPYTDFSEFYTE